MSSSYAVQRAMTTMPKPAYGGELGGTGAENRGTDPPGGRRLCETHQRYFPIGHPSCVICDIEGAAVRPDFLGEP